MPNVRCRRPKQSFEKLNKSAIRSSGRRSNLLNDSARREATWCTSLKACSMISGTNGYAEEADELVKRYESISFAEKHRPVLHLIPSSPISVLDIGAGTGADAAFLSASGHRVVAVEPTDELRVPGISLHPSALIEWVNDSLPGLTSTQTRGQKFDLVMMTAVWMHLDDLERQQAMPNVVSLIRHGGVLIMSLRHGPSSPRRRMFEVSAEETIRLAQANGLRSVLNVRTQSAQPVNRRAGVEWSHLAFAYAG
jgi:2-polyprenyl-3-methyl-5-hydroxy-6-metoxy-1,4-benzoquinol methylase